MTEFAWTVEVGNQAEFQITMVNIGQPRRNENHGRACLVQFGVQKNADLISRLDLTEHEWTGRVYSQPRDAQR